MTGLLCSVSRNCRLCLVAGIWLGFASTACSGDAGTPDAADDARVADDAGVANDAAGDDGRWPADAPRDSSALDSPVTVLDIPAERLLEWDPGVRGGIPAVPTRVSVRDFGAKGDGVTDDWSAFDTAIKTVSTPGAVLVPAGIYFLGSSIDLRSGVVLRGEGPSSTTLRVMLSSSSGGAVRMVGPGGSTFSVQGSVAAGASSITLASDPTFGPGAYLEIGRDNEPSDPSSWGEPWIGRVRGQVLRVAAVAGRTITTDVPVRLTYDSARQPQVRAFDPIQMAGIEALRIDRQDSGHNHIVYFARAANCWVKDCELHNCGYSHVFLETSRHVTVEGCYMHDAHSYGGNGEGYGAVAHVHTSDCLVTNNVFRNLRHSMLVQLGASGNVYSYNYSIENLAYPPTDMSIHGLYSYMNLFEGNDVARATVSDDWGPTGPHTTLFRNRCRQYIRVQDSSHDANVLGNSILGQPVECASRPCAQPPGLRVESSCQRAWVERNLIFSTAAGAVFQFAPDTTDIENYLGDAAAPRAWSMPPSLYLQGPPAFWGQREWPAIGSDVDSRREGDYVKLPAQQRYEQGW